MLNSDTTLRKRLNHLYMSLLKKIVIILCYHFIIYDYKYNLSIKQEKLELKS